MYRLCMFASAAAIAGACASSAEALSLRIAEDSSDASRRLWSIVLSPNFAAAAAVEIGLEFV
ncbi:MAG: hypothetical protein KDA61_05770, partial [Planctomycetales bacterium]|nr:hypothetical protein [Planctomycetales bacterium]